MVKDASAYAEKRKMFDNTVPYYSHNEYKEMKFVGVKEVIKNKRNLHRKLKITKKSTVMQPRDIAKLRVPSPGSVSDSFGMGNNRVPIAQKVNLRI
jgi:hypothetical protein